MPWEQTGSRRPHDLVERKLVAMVVPATVANMVAILTDRHLSEAARVAVDELIARLRKIERCAILGRVSSDSKDLVSDLGSEAKDDQLRMSIAMKQADRERVRREIALSQDVDAVPTMSRNVINDLLLALVFPGYANHLKWHLTPELSRAAKRHRLE